MTSSLRERRRQMLYDEILLAVGELLTEKGYAAMSMDELAARVGVSKPTLYSHFPTKDDLLVAAMMDGIRRVSAAIEADPTPRSPLERLVFILRTVLQMQVDKGALTPRPWSPEILQVLCSRAEIVELLQSHESIILELVRAGIVDGEINSALDPAVVVRAFYAFINTLHLPFMSQMNASAPTAVADTLVTIFERGVRAPTA